MNTDSDLTAALRHLRPADLTTAPETGMPGLLVNMVTRACYDRIFKRLSGWQGMSMVKSNPAACTFKIKKRPGLFGVCHANSITHGNMHTSEFIICYFPEINETIADHINLSAALTMHRPGYIEKTRDFLSYDHMIDPFTTGHMYMTLDNREEAMLLRLESPSRKRIVSADGIKSPDHANGEYIVPPGGHEEDLPAFEIAMDLFSAVCAAATYNLKSAPVFYRRLEKPGSILSYNSAGNISRIRTERFPDMAETLGYGDISSVNRMIRNNPGETAEDGILRRTVWCGGDDYPPTVADMFWWKAHDPGSISPADSPSVCDRRPQFIVLTGFLGSGKTTFASNFVEYHNSRNNFVAVIQNEIGETGLDGKLLGNRCSVVEMDEGCVCCTLSGRLSTGISTIMDRFTPQVILLETTGLANPFNLLAEIDELKETVRFDSVTTIVDCSTALNALDEYKIAYDQVSAADIVIMNKTDLAPPEELRKIEQALRKINPGAFIFNTEFGNLNPGLLYSDDVETGISGADADHAGPMRSPDPGDEPHSCHGDEGIGAVRINFSGPLNRSDFKAVFHNLPPEILRIKGIVHFSDSGTAEVCQYVGGRVDFSRYAGPDQQAGFVIVIGKNINPDKLPGVLSNAYHTGGRSAYVPDRPVFNGCSCSHH